MKHYGDITKIRGNEVEPVDIIVGGSPCQDLSVAGKRAGLEGERSGLFMEQIRIIKEMRASGNNTVESIRRPRYMVWENVPGCLNSGKNYKGEDFRIVLEETARVVEEGTVIPRPAKDKWSNSGCVMGDGWSIAWRIHDAQFWGVPQRRRRISLVADFRGLTAPEILFEREGVSRDLTESGEAKQDSAGDTGESVENAKRSVFCVDQGAGKSACAVTKDQAPTLACTHDGSPVIALENHPADSRVKICEDGMVQTLSGRMGTGGNNVPLVMSSNWDGSQVSPTLTQHNAGGGQRMPDKDNFNAILQVKGVCEEVSYGLDRASFNQGQNAQFDFSVDEELQPSLTARGPGAVCQEYTVRRLTPLECERLQGFPDNWTDIGEWVDSKGKKRQSTDSMRYKALGNSIALPFWQWLAERMCKYLDHPTLGSLFDGIGGFPLVFSRVGCTPVWNSEIEEFCEAVTKKRFDEE